MVTSWTEQMAACRSIPGIDCCVKPAMPTKRTERQRSTKQGTVARMIAWLEKASRCKVPETVFVCAGLHLLVRLE